MRHKIWALGMVLLSCGVSACSSGHEGPTAPASPGPNPNVIPAVITPAYIDAVFKVLNHLDGDVSRSLINGPLTPTDVRLLRAIYGDPLYQIEIHIAQESKQQDLGNVKRPPGDRVTIVLNVIDSNPSCIFVSTRSDYSQVLIHPTAPSVSEFWRLSRKNKLFDPDKLNSTPWALTFNASYTTSTTIPDQCSAA